MTDLHRLDAGAIAEGVASRRAEAFTERLMIYALGRGVEAYDMPAIRAIRAQSAGDNYRIQSIILGIVQSVPFTMRRTPQNDDHA